MSPIFFGRSVGRRAAPRRAATRSPHRRVTRGIARTHSESIVREFLIHPPPPWVERATPTRAHRRGRREDQSSRVRGAGAIAARARNDARARHGARRARGGSVEELLAREVDREGDGDDDRGRRSFRETRGRGGAEDIVRASGRLTERAPAPSERAGEVVQRGEGVRVHRPG